MLVEYLLSTTESHVTLRRKRLIVPLLVPSRYNRQFPPNVGLILH